MLQGGLIWLEKNEKQLLQSAIRLIQIRNKASILYSEADDQETGEFSLLKCLCVSILVLKV